MHLSLTSATLLYLVLGTKALPRFLPRVNFFQDVLVLDAPAFQNPENPSETLVQMQSFAFVKQIDLKGASGIVEKILSGAGVDVGNAIETVLDRVKLFGAVGVAGVDVEMDVAGCSTPARLPGTSGLPDLGIVLANVSLGKCNSVGQLSALHKTSGIDPRTFTANIFSSAPDGFGVISDIDDTVKISNVLDKPKLIKATLIDDPTPVTGMPDLYASLSKSLNSPQFIYVSGSPFQLYPFLSGFINTTYPLAKGPIFLRNLSITDLDTILQFTKSGGVFEYKSAQIDRIRGMYPKKKFLAVGDSTEKDPETYGEAFRKYGNFIQCIWIRKVDNANNTAERFDQAFRDVPANKIKLYTDDEIPSLQKLDVAGGQCN